MKKYLLSIFFILSIVFTGNAQTLSGNKFVDEMLGAVDETDYAEMEKMFAEIGIKTKISAYFDSKRNQLVCSYKLYDQQVYDIWDNEKVLDESIKGMINNVMKLDNAGNAIIMVGNEFKRTNTGIRTEVLYKNKKKSASATADEIIEIVYNMFQ